LHEDDQKNIALISSHSLGLEKGRDTQEGKEVIDSKVREEDFQEGNWYSCGTKERENQICTRIFIVYAKALIRLGRSLSMIPSTYLH
jgi:hypothetical protein